MTRVCLQVYPAGYDRTIVEVQGTVMMAPQRTLLVPFSLLIPDIPIRATIKLGVRGPLESGTVRASRACACARLCVRADAFMLCLQPCCWLHTDRLCRAQIELLDGQWHNLPSLPAPIRALNGFIMGQLTQLSEPAW